VIGTRNFSASVAELKDAVDQCFWVKEELGYYSSRNWIFESTMTEVLQKFVAASGDA